MAEGGNLSRTLEGGSEALFDHECIQCRTHGSRQEAFDFCQDCKQFLCNTCGKYHIRNMTTHTLINVASMEDTQPVQPTTSPVTAVAKCHYHPDRDIEMFCGTHDMVYCSLCVAKEHRSCVNVQEIKDVAHTSQLSILQALTTDITKVTKRLQDTKLEKSNDLKLIRKQKTSLLQEIKAVRKRMNKHLDALEQKIIAELDAEERKLERKINAEMNSADALITASEQRKPDLTTSFDGFQMFITEKIARVVLAEANSFLEDGNVSKFPTLKFDQNVALCTAIEKSDQMGNIVIANNIPQRTQHRQYTVNTVHDINFGLTSEKRKCLINDICQLPDGTILVTDYSNCKLKRLDDQLIVKDWVKITGVPNGLCSVSPTEVAVRTKGNTIQFISVSKSLSYQQTVAIDDFNYKQSGMVCCNNQLWMPGDKAVFIYSLSGSIVKKIETDSKGRTLFPDHDPQRIAVNNDETKVYVAAWQDRVIVFNNFGDAINELRDNRLIGTRGTCIAEDGIVLVAGHSSKNVIMFDRDGNSIGELVTSKDMLSNPWSVCYDRCRGRLLVGCSLSDSVRIFQLC